MRGLVAVLAALACTGALAQACQESQDIAAVSRHAAAVDAPEGATGRTEKVTLPDQLSLADRSERVRIRYDIDVAACAGREAASLWVFRAGAPYRITAGGQPLTLMSANALAMAPGNPTGGVNLHNGRIPALFALPAGVTQVSLELQTLPYIPYGIVRLAMGPTNQMLGTHAAAVRSVVGYADAASGVMLVIGLLSFLLWLPRRRDLNLLWLAVACGLWGVRGLIYFNNEVPGHATLFEMLNPVNALLSASALAAASLHLIDHGEQRRRALRLLSLLTVAALLPALVALLAGYGAALARVLLQVVGTGFICWMGLAFWQRRRELPARHTAGLLACVAVVLGCVGHDLMVATGVLPPSSRSVVFWGFVLVLVGFALISGEYVVRTLDQAEHNNEDLELRVARKTEELESSYARLRDNERDAARSAERERIMREMHDGLGAQLMTALRGMERGALGEQQVAQSLQEGLDELRLLMDSSEDVQALQTALANWRNRWDARLAATGLNLRWTIDDSLEGVDLPGDTVLQIMRVLQEAGANIVKHAQASEAAVMARVQAGSLLVLEIVDNGVGLPAGHEVNDMVAHGGRGLRNMRQRAQQIGARLEVQARQDGAQGTAVRLYLPLQPGSAT